MKSLTEVEIDELILLQSELMRAIFFYSRAAMTDSEFMKSYAREHRAKAQRDLKKFYMEHYS